SPSVRKPRDSADGLGHCDAIDRVYIDLLADGRQHGQRETAAQVLTELLESVEERVGIPKSRMSERQPEPRETIEGPFGILLGQSAYERRIDGIDGDADTHGFAVPQIESGEDLQFVGRPVA